MPQFVRCLYGRDVALSKQRDEGVIILKWEVKLNVWPQSVRCLYGRDVALSKQRDEGVIILKWEVKLTL